MFGGSEILSLIGEPGPRPTYCGKISKRLEAAQGGRAHSHVEISGEGTHLKYRKNRKDYWIALSTDAQDANHHPDGTVHHNTLLSVRPE